MKHLADLEAAALQQPGAVRRDGAVKFQCPDCRAEGHDAHRDNAGYFLNSRQWGCAVGLAAHWRAIGEALGVFSQHNGAPLSASPSTAAMVETPVAAPETPAPETAPYTFRSAFPPGHFIADFIAYASSRTDAAAEYHEAVAFVGLATATPGLRAAIKQYARGLSTNLYIILIGDSTSSRKSTSADYGIDLVHDVQPDSLIANQSSPEATLEMLADRDGDGVLWHVDEIGEMIDKLHHAKYMAGLRGLLLSLYDGRSYTYRRTSKKHSKEGGGRERDELVIKHPHFSILGATTPSLFEILTARDVDSGFLARFAVIFPTSKPARRALEEEERTVEGQIALEAQRANLAHRLHLIHLWGRADRRARFAPGALGIIDQFAQRIETAASSTPERATAMLQRLSPMAVKIALLTAVGRATTPDVDELVVTQEDAQIAVTVAERWRGYAIAVAQRIGENDFERLMERAVRVVRQHKRLARREVARLVHCPKKIMDDIEATLLDRGEITVTMVKAPSGPDARVWSITP